jgi:PRTRC genetic system protein B
MNEKLSLAHIMHVYENDTNTVYAESAVVVKGKPGTFMPLSENSFKNMFSLANEANRSKYMKGLLDPGILSFSDRIDDQHIIWYREAMKRTVKTSSESYTVYMPAMLFHVKSDQLHLYALKSNNRPHTYTELFYAPVKNLKGDMTVFCWGNVKPKIKSFSVNDIIKEWESYIWDSNFNNNGPDKIKSGNTYKLYTELKKSGKKFPKAELLTTRKKLGDIL